MNRPISWQLSRNVFGRLVFANADRQTEGVTAVRAFPLTAPDAGIALVAGNGEELAWIDNLDGLPVAIRALVAEELSGREFMPVIERIRKVSSYVTPSTWQVVTDRGETALVLRGEEDIRRFGSHSLLIGDKHGIQFLIRDQLALDAHSRRILDRFL